MFKQNKISKLYKQSWISDYKYFIFLQNNVLNGFLQMENIVLVHYANAEIPVACPTQEQVNVMISSLMIQG